jgi:hypothetical protein
MLVVYQVGRRSPSKICSIMNLVSCEPSEMAQAYDDLATLMPSIHQQGRSLGGLQKNGGTLGQARWQILSMLKVQYMIARRLELKYEGAKVRQQVCLEICQVHGRD